MKYTSKPTTVEATQYFRGKETPGVKVPVPGDGEPYVKTIHGNICEVQDGDYIIQEPDGIHYYPCKPDIFQARYFPTPSPEGHIQ